MQNSKPEEEVKAPNLLERAKEEIDAMVHSDNSHHKETHVTSDDINVDTPVDKVKGPNIFERVKEELEAIVEAVHPTKESDHDSHSKKEMDFCELFDLRRLEILLCLASSPY